MRIAFLCKRRYMSKDVILDRYARLYEIPRQLARLGHEVRGYCLDYHAQTSGRWQHEAAPGSLIWQSRSVGRLRFPGLINHPAYLLRQLRMFSPDILIGASDIPHVVLTAWLSEKLKTPYAVDLYDNFEGFGQARIPGFVSALRRAVCHAGLVTATSEPLQRMVKEVYGALGTVIAMPSSVDKTVFKPLDKTAARIRLGLPLDATLVGTAGALSRDKGITALYDAWPTIADASPNTHLVLAGPAEEAHPPPSGPRVLYLGKLAHEQIADLFNALDVGVITILDTPFGRYSFPQKAYEMLACRLPIVAANIGAMSSLFAETTHALFTPEDSSALATAVLRQLDSPALPLVDILSWGEQIAAIDCLLQTLVSRTPPRSLKTRSQERSNVNLFFRS